MGEVTLRVAGTVVLEKALPSLKQYFDGIQFGLEQGGVERVIHRVRKEMRDAGGAKVCVTLDCKNAFNSMFRRSIRDVVSTIPYFAGYFNSAYARPSRLLVRQGDKWNVVTSSRGGKQGDTAMPALFSLTLHPVIADITTLFRCLCLAFLDDITLVGTPQEVVAAVREIERRLATIGLELNRSKCEVYGADAEEVAKALGFKVSNGGIKVLGAWITYTPEHAPALAAFLQRNLDKTQTMFDRLLLLPLDVAWPLLCRCGVPRWNHIIRTHDPAEIAHMTKAFDDKVLATALQLLGIPSRDLLTKQQLMQLHLPCDVGGLGITNNSLIASAAYSASIDPSGDDQSVRVEALNTSILKELCVDKDFERHLHRCSKRHASAWIFSTETPGFRGALQMRIRYTPPSLKSKVKCQCGLTCTPAEMDVHIQGCTRTKSNFPATRHHLAQTENRNLCKECAVQVTNSPVTGGKKRADDLLHLLSGDMLIDYTIVNEGAKSYSKKSSAEIEAAKDNTKQTHYADGLDGRQLVTFHIDTLGGFSNGALKIIKAITSEGSMSSISAVKRMSKKIICSTGFAMLQARRALNIENSPNPHSTSTLDIIRDVKSKSLSISGVSQSPAPCRTSTSDTIQGPCVANIPCPSTPSQSPASCRTSISDTQTAIPQVVTVGAPEPNATAPCRTSLSGTNAAAAVPPPADDDDQPLNSQTSNVPGYGASVERVVELEVSSE